MDLNFQYPNEQLLPLASLGIIDGRGLQENLKTRSRATSGISPVLLKTLWTDHCYCDLT